MSIYMNNGATSWPKAPGVAEALAQFLTCQGANAGRGTTSSRDLSTMVGLLATRQKLAAFLAAATLDGSPLRPTSLKVSISFCWAFSKRA